MPFNELMLKGITLSTSHKEHGVHVSTERKLTRGELFIKFCIDPSSEGCGHHFKECINTLKICDLLYYFHDKNRTILCLVELKNSDLKKAADQLITTKTNFEKALRKMNGYPKGTIIWKAAIVKRCAHLIPGKRNQIQKDISKHFYQHRIAHKKIDIYEFITSEEERS